MQRGGGKLRILIVAAEAALAALLKRELEEEGHLVACAWDGSAAIQELAARPADLLIFDLSGNLPIDPCRDLSPSRSPMPSQDEAAEDCLNVLSRLRAADRDVPILVLTERREVQARVDCLDRGADDCMFKPLSLQELRARCRALLRRRRGGEMVLRCQGIELDRVSHRVEQQGRAVPLTNKEFALLEHLMMNRGSCVSRAALLAEVWNQSAQEPEGGRDTNVVDVYINYLRRKLGSDKSSVIHTVRGQGYLVGVTNNPRSALADA